MEGEQDDFNEGGDSQTVIEIETEIIISDEEETNDAAAKYVKHGEKVKALPKKEKWKAKKYITTNVITAPSCSLVLEVGVF